MKKKNHPTSPHPDLDISIPMPVPCCRSPAGAQAAGESLSLAVSLQACRDREDAPDIVSEVIDIFGSSVAMASGWVPPEEEAES